MSLYYIFTVDGDWGEYFSTELPNQKRRPDRKDLLCLIKREVKVACSIKGKILHLVHTSPVAREYFLQPEFVALWKKLEEGGGSIGVHCHEEELFSHGRLNDPEKLERAIHSITRPLRDKGLNLISYRGGYLAFCRSIIPILEKNDLLLDFSCDPGRYLRLEGELIADWRGAPETHYRMSYEDHRKPGNSKVIEIPLGKAGGGTLYIEITSLLSIWKAARALAKKVKEEKRDIIVSVLSHTYEFASFWKRLKIKLALFTCKKYGIFVSDEEALEIINQQKI